MFDWLTSLILNLVPIAESLGFYLYLIILGIALMESTPVIGTFTPGTLMLLFFGFMVSVTDTSLVLAILGAVLGGVLGDCLGYALGRYGGRFFKEHKGLLRIGHIEMGRAFFSKHGGKSIFVGRFVGPIRPIIPLVAGAVRMSMRRFLPLNISAALSWATLLIVAGYLAGSEWQRAERIVSDATYILGGLFVIVVAHFAYKIYKNRKNGAVHVDAVDVV